MLRPAEPYRNPPSWILIKAGGPYHACRSRSTPLSLQDRSPSRDALNRVRGGRVVFPTRAAAEQKTQSDRLHLQSRNLFPAATGGKHMNRSPILSEPKIFVASTLALLFACAGGSPGPEVETSGTRNALSD